MFCGRSRMPPVVNENSTTTATRAMKMPFLPRSASTCVSHEVNLFSVGLMLPPTACDSVGVGVVGLDMGFFLFFARGSAGAFHGHELEDRLGRRVLDGELARDAPLGERVDAVGDAEQLGQLGGDHDDALP